MKDFVPVMFDCNDNCISCPVPRKGDKINPSIEDIKKEIDNILQSSNHIALNGGEPLLRKDWRDILYYIQSKGNYEISFLTNAELLCSLKNAKLISQINGLKIITTIYGHNAEIHDSITRNPGSFFRKMQALDNLIKLRARIELRILLHKMNYVYFRDICNFLITNFSSTDFERIVVMSAKFSCNAFTNKDKVFIPLNELSKVLEKPLLMLQKKKFRVELFHFPHCILSERLRILSKGITADDYAVSFAKICVKCKEKDNCSGIWTSYLNLAGDEEFNPLI